MANKEKLSLILEERNRLIKHYREKCEGLEEINTLIKTLLFFVLCRNGETKINKKELSEALGKYTLKFRADGLDYFISVAESEPSVAIERGDSDEEAKI